MKLKTLICRCIIGRKAIADFRPNEFEDRLSPQAQKAKSLRDDKLYNAGMGGGVQREVSFLPSPLTKPTKWLDRGRLVRLRH